MASVVDGLIIALIVALIGIAVKNSVWIWRLYDMHNKFDDSGKPLWYVPNGLDSSLSMLASSIEKHTVAVEAQSKLLKELVREIKHVPREVIREMAVNKIIQ